MNSLNGVNFGISIRQISHLEAIFVYTHAQYPILSQIDVLVVQHLLFGIWVDAPPALVDTFREQHPQNHIGG